MEVDKTRPFVRYQEAALAREAGLAVSWTPPDCCDLCGGQLPEASPQPFEIEWRTSERETENKVSGVTALTIFAGVVVRNRRVEWEQKNGLYFLCPHCRNDISPDLKRLLPGGFTAIALVLGLGLVAALIQRDVSFLMLAVFASIWAFPIGMALTSGNRYRGYPQDMGFSLHSSTIQGNGCSMGCLLTIGIWVLLLGTAAALQFAGQSYKSYFVDSRIENQVAGISLSKADIPMDPEQCAQSLDRLAKASGSTREEVGQAIIAAWKAHAKTYTALYRRERALFFQELEKASAAQPEVPIKELAERLVSRTPASYLAGAQEGKSKPPFATEARFESLLESISPLANSSAGALEVQFQASRKLESAWRGLLAGGVKLDLLTFVRAVERNMDMLGKNLDSAIKTVSSDIFVHPERFLKPSKKKTPAK